jgi:hypothetical protein
MIRSLRRESICGQAQEILWRSAGMRDEFARSARLFSACYLDLSPC